jgi:predicted nucleic acid-binding protein
MQRAPRSFSPGDLRFATHVASGQVADAIQAVQDMTNDAQKDERLAKHFCKACFYLRRRTLAGQAFTHQPCACCLEEQTYSSTNTDALCLACAQEHKLCKHCSADIELDSAREEWPDKPASAP